MLVRFKNDVRSSEILAVRQQFERIMDYFYLKYDCAIVPHIDNRFDYFVFQPDGHFLLGFVEDFSKLKNFKLKDTDMKQLNGAFIDKTGNVKFFFWNKKEEVDDFLITSLPDTNTNEKDDRNIFSLKELAKSAYLICGLK